MNEATIGTLVLLAISAVVAATTHWFCRRFIAACFYAALVATILFQIAAFLHAGNLDPFFPIAVIVGGCIAFVAALATGVVVRQIRSTQS